MRIDPDFSLGHQFLGEAYAREGKQAEAIDELQKAAALSQRSPIALARLGFTYALLGQRENALEVAHELEEKHKLRRADGAFVAVVYAGLRDNDKVFEWLNKDQTHSLIVAQVVFWWEFQTVHDDPRWTTYMHKVRLR